MYHCSFSLWEYLLLRKYNWFAGSVIWFSSEETVEAPYAIRLLFIAQIVQVSFCIDLSPSGSSRHIDTCL